MKSIVATHILTSPLMASLFNHSVRRQMGHCLICTSEPCLIFCVDLIKSGVKCLLYSVVVNRLYSAGKEQSGDSFEHLQCHLFSCITFILILGHASGVHSFWFIISLKLSYHLFRFFVACFDVFGSDSIAVC